MAKKIIIVLYSTYGHLFKLSQEIKKGIEKTGAEVKIYKVAETLPEEGLNINNHKHHWHHHHQLKLHSLLPSLPLLSSLPPYSADQDVRFQDRSACP